MNRISHLKRVLNIYEMLIYLHRPYFVHIDLQRTRTDACNAKLDASDELLPFSIHSFMSLFKRWTRIITFNFNYAKYWALTGRIQMGLFSESMFELWTLNLSTVTVFHDAVMYYNRLDYSLLSFSAYIRLYYSIDIHIFITRFAER